MTPQEIEELEKLCEAATPGPWKLFEHGGAGDTHYAYVTDANNRKHITDDKPCDSQERYDDLKFIAATRTAVPKLIKLIYKQSAELFDYEQGLRETLAKDELEAEIAHLRQRLEKQESDWNAISERAARLSQQVTELQAELAREIERRRGFEDACRALTLDNSRLKAEATKADDEYSQGYDAGYYNGFSDGQNGGET